MKKYLLFVLLITTLGSKGQILFSKIIGDTIDRVGVAKTISTSDGGFLLCGSFQNSPLRHNAMLLKCDLNGDTMWTSVLSDTNSDFHSVVELPLRQGFMCIGSSYPNGIICWIDSLGNLILEKKTSLSYPSAIINSTNNSLLILGYQTGGGAILIKTDYTSTIYWAKELNYCNVYLTDNLIQESNGDIFIAGSEIDSYGDTPALFKFDSTGNFIWSYGYSFFSNDISGEFISIDTAFDGKFLLVAKYGDSHVGSWDNIEYTKIDTDGTAIWTRYLPLWAPYRSDGKIFPISETTYGLIGYNELFGERPYLITMDSSGIPLTTKVFPFIGTRQEVNQLSNHQIIFSLSVDSVSLSKLYLLDSLGNGICDMLDTAVISVDTTLRSEELLNPTIGIPTISTNNASDSITRGIPIQTDCLLISAVESGIKNPLTEIIISPNPTTGQFVISSTEFADKNSLIEIFNTLGEKIYSAVYHEGLTVNCELFPPGIYFVRLSDSQKQLIRKLVIE